MTRRAGRAERGNRKERFMTRTVWTGEHVPPGKEGKALCAGMGERLFKAVRRAIFRAAFQPVADKARA